MTTRHDTLAEIARLSARPILLGLRDLDEADRARQAAGLPNHAAWTLGHCALTMHRAAERIDGEPLPAADFVAGDGTAGDGDRYDTESVCFGSVPVGEASRYPTLGRGRVIFDAAIERLARAAGGADDETLDRSTTWGVVGDELSLAGLVQRVAIHNGVHGGQLLDLRRALALPPLFA